MDPQTQELVAVCLLLAVCLGAWLTGGEVAGPARAR